MKIDLQALADRIEDREMNHEDYDHAADALRAMSALIAQCRAAGFIDDDGKVRKVLGNRWHCSYCDSVYAEYCNGCPRCHLGEPGTATSLQVVKIVSTTESALAAKEADIDVADELEKKRRAAIVDRVMSQHVCGSNGFRDVEGATCDACERERAKEADRGE